MMHLVIAPGISGDDLRDQGVPAFAPKRWSRIDDRVRRVSESKRRAAKRARNLRCERKRLERLGPDGVRAYERDRRKRSREKRKAT